MEVFRQIHASIPYSLFSQVPKGMWEPRKKGNRYSVNLHQVCNSEMLISTAVWKRSADSLYLLLSSHCSLCGLQAFLFYLSLQIKNYSEPVLQCETSVRLKTMLVLGLSQETSQSNILDRQINSVCHTNVLIFICFNQRIFSSQKIQYDKAVSLKELMCSRV